MDRSPMSASSQIVDRHGRNFNYLRLAVNEYCNLRCIYCMPEEGVPFRQKIQLLSTSEIKRLLSISAQIGVSKIRFTGGEPLFQDECIDLLKELINQNYEVMLETGGSLPISAVPKEVIKIVDFKCPTSNMEKKNNWDNGLTVSLVKASLQDWLSSY